MSRSVFPRTVPPSHPACPNRPKSHRPVPIGSTRSSTTASASWRAATARACGSTPATAPISPTAFRGLSKPSKACRCGPASSTARRSWSTSSGLAVFDLLRSWRHDHAAVLCAFDLIELDGKDLRRTPIEERKAALGQSAVPRRRDGIAFNQHYRRRRRDHLQACLHARLRRHRVEAARLDVPLRPGQ